MSQSSPSQVDVESTSSIEKDCPITSPTSDELREKSTTPVDDPYSVFTFGEKWFIAGMASVGCFLSPLSANIYLPALPTLVQDFHKSQEAINLTITVYMILQGISPMIWGTLADLHGRRSIYLGCLALMVLSCVGIALVPTNAYWLLMLLRCFQSAGSASTVALGAGVIIDIAQRQERGTFLGVYSLGPMLGPAIGPVIGGLLSGGLGWRAIFWFLAILGACTLLAILFFFPETLRSIVGNGTLPPQKFNKPLIPLLTPHYTAATSPSPEKVKHLANPLLLFTHPDVLLILLYNAIIYSIFYAVTTTISVLFAENYPSLTQIELGLCFLPLGVGTIVGAFVNGKMLDREYRSIQRRVDAKSQDKKDGDDTEKGQPKEVDFPIELARLRLVPFYTAFFCVLIVGYGWAVDKRANLAIPLILSFFIGWMVVAVMNTHQNLIMDLFPAQGSSITAANNLVRCSLGAALVSSSDPMFRALTPGWSFVLLAGIAALSWPMDWYEMRFGCKYRLRRKRREEDRIARENQQQAS